MMSLYDISKSYLENGALGPFFQGEIPKISPKTEKVDFLGFKLNSPIGVPAGPLLNSKWIALAASLGFDVPTYKTIRSSSHPGHPLPNILFVETVGANQARQIEQPEQIEQISITNSFGMPSMSPEFLMEDIEKANRSLNEGQVMIVSVVGTENPLFSFLDDFIRTALLAKEAGAKIIEANFSCPNVGKAEGSLYQNPKAVAEFASQIRAAIHPVPLLIKVGPFSSIELMEEVFLAAARAGCAGICGLNSISMEVIGSDGKSALGPTRKTSGVCGALIRQQALQFIRAASKIQKEQKLDLALLGCGGIMRPEHFSEMLDAGASIAMSATAMMWDPYLAIRFKEMSYAR